MLHDFSDTADNEIRDFLQMVARCVYIHLFFYLFIHLSICPFYYAFIQLFIICLLCRFSTCIFCSFSQLFIRLFMDLFNHMINLFLYFLTRLVTHLFACPNSVSFTCFIHPFIKLSIISFDIYLRKGGYVFARLCLFVCLSVCLCVSKITQKVMDGSF